MRTLGAILLSWLVGTLVTHGQAPLQGQPNQPLQPVQNPYPPRPMGQVIQPVQATGQPGAGFQPAGGFQTPQGQPGTGLPGTGQPGLGQPGTGQPGSGQPVGQRPMGQPGNTGLPQPVLGGQPAPVNPLPPAQPLDPQNPLDRVLMSWEGEMMKVQTLAAQLERVETDLAFKATKKATGYAQYMRQNGPKTVNLAMLDLREKENPKILVEKFICTGTYLYQYSPAQQVIRAFKMPEPPPGQVANDNFLAFLFGMRAQEAKRRYEMKLGKEDQYYYYIDILPRLSEDKADFARAQVVLNKGSFLPRMLWFENNGTTTTWDIPAIKSGVQVDPTGFDAPRPPQGWKLIEVPPEQQGQPKLIRGQ